MTMGVYGKLSEPTNIMWIPGVDPRINDNLMELLLLPILTHRGPTLLATIEKFVTHVSGGVRVVIPSTELTALRAERDAALARVKVLEAAINPPFPETWRDDAHDVHDRPGLRAQRTWAAGFNACRAASLAATEGKPL